MKPPIPYYGSKQTLAPWIVSMLPPHDHYVEPFAGSLAVLLAKKPSRMETVNDLNSDLMTFWRVLRNRPDEFIRVCALTPHSRAEHDIAWQPTDDELELARRIWVRLTQGRSNALQGRIGWRRVIAANTPMPTNLKVSIDRLATAAERLASVSLECLPALEIIDRYGAEPSVLLYLDPPYLADTRNGSHYRHDMKTADEHRQLAEALTRCRAAVVLSGYHSPLYDELYQGWHRYEASTFTGNGVGDKTRTEVLWSNRVLAGQVDLFAEVSA